LRDLEAARRDPNRRHEIPTLEKNYNKLLRQANFAGAQAKRTFDLRNITPVGTLLKATGAGRIAEGTKKNYADIVHSEAEKAARAGVEAAISQKGATAIAKERVKETYGDAEKEHEDAQQQVRDTRQRMRQIREEGERVAEQHEREARQAREHQQELERQHATATDEAERTRLQTQITTVGERIAAARRSAQNARERANNKVARMLPELKTLETKATLARDRLSDFNEEVKKETAAVLEGNRQFVGEVAKGFVGNKFQQTLYRAFGVGDTHMLHDAEAAAQARAQIKEKAEEKKKIDNYDKPAHAPAAPSGAAPAGGDHH
jgi:chromosome segregation ATPase